jgi:hypothetical protein
MALNIQNNVFRDLVGQHPKWDDLRAYLESEAGGMFRIVDTNDTGLALIRYEKNTTNMDLEHSKWFRSVVWNTHLNRPVSVAPPKTTSLSLSFTTLKEVNEAGLVCQELMDGFMVNCCRVSGDDTVYITTRSKLDATGKFYSEKTFRELFLESYLNTTQSSNLSNDLPGPDSMKGEIATFYSFLVQNKLHRIVKPITQNSVYLVYHGTVLEDGTVCIIDAPSTFNNIPTIESIKVENTVSSTKGTWSQVLTRTVEEDGLTELDRWIKNYILDKTWQFQGLVLKDSVGNRWRFRSEKYLAVKSLRGNTPLLRNIFAQLYTQNLVHTYLEYYPEDMLNLTQCYMLLHTLIKRMYNYYVELHITKQITVESIDKMYLPHLYNLHGLYLTQLKPNKKKITFGEVQLYFHKLPWERVAFLMKKCE